MTLRRVYAPFQTNNSQFSTGQSSLQKPIIVNPSTFQHQYTIDNRIPYYQPHLRRIYTFGTPQNQLNVDPIRFTFNKQQDRLMHHLHSNPINESHFRQISPATNPKLISFNPNEANNFGNSSLLNSEAQSKKEILKSPMRAYKPSLQESNATGYGYNLDLIGTKQQKDFVPCCNCFNPVSFEIKSSKKMCP